MHSLRTICTSRKEKESEYICKCWFSDWHNIIDRQSIHVERKYHKDAIKDSHNLINRFEKPEGTIDYHSDTVYHERCNKYPEILEVIARAIHFHRTTKLLS